MSKILEMGTHLYDKIRVSFFDFKAEFLPTDSLMGEKNDCNDGYVIGLLADKNKLYYILAFQNRCDAVNSYDIRVPEAFFDKEFCDFGFSLTKNNGTELLQNVDVVQAQRKNFPIEILEDKILLFPNSIKNSSLRAAWSEYAADTIFRYPCSAQGFWVTVLCDADLNIVKFDDLKSEVELLFPDIESDIVSASGKYLHHKVELRGNNLLFEPNMAKFSGGIRYNDSVLAMMKNQVTETNAYLVSFRLERCFDYTDLFYYHCNGKLCDYAFILSQSMVSQLYEVINDNIDFSSECQFWSSSLTAPLDCKYRPNADLFFSNILLSKVGVTECKDMCTRLLGFVLCDEYGQLINVAELKNYLIYNHKTDSCYPNEDFLPEDKSEVKVEVKSETDIEAISEQRIKWEVVVLLVMGITAIIAYLFA